MTRRLTLILLATLALTSRAWPQPAAAVAAARQDCAALHKSQAAYTRYLDLGNIPPGDREQVYLVLSGHIQHLSTAPDRERPRVVPGTGGSLLRLDLRDYNWPAALWETLADVDPFYHVQLVTVAERKVSTPWPGGAYQGTYYAPGSFNTYHTVKERKVQTALAPWLGDARVVADLVKLTGSKAPVLRGDWFFWQTAAAQNRKPNYYDFLGVKDSKTFEAVVGFDGKLAARFGDDLRSSVSRSGVTLQPRALLRQATLGGALWKSFDFQVGVDGKNALRVFGKDIEKEFDATEQYGMLPNRFWATALFNGKGERQDVAPNFIAGDSRSHSNDKQVHVNISCVRCHTVGGLQDIKDFTRNLLKPPFALNVEDYDKYLALRREYLRGLEAFVDEDRARYARAVKEVTGWDTTLYARRYSELWQYTEDAEVDLARAARDLGVSEERFTRALRRQVQLGTADPVLGALLLPGERRETLGYRQWQEAVPLAHSYLVGIKE